MRVSNDKVLTGKFLCFGWVITYGRLVAHERWSHMEKRMYTNSISKKMKKQILQVT